MIVYNTGHADSLETEIKHIKADIINLNNKKRQAIDTLMWTRRNERKARGSRELRWVGKFFRAIEVYSTHLGIYVELGTVKQQNVAHTKRFFEDNGFKVVEQVENNKHSALTYEKDDGILYFIKYMKEVV